MSKRWVRVLLLLLLLLLLPLPLTLEGCAAAPPGPDPHAGAPASPPATSTRQGAITLTNGIVRLEVAPQAGRIVSFGRFGGQNLLWLNADEPPPGDAYINYGGDKLWVTPQSLWSRARGTGGSWPPDPVIDGQPWRIVDQSPQQIIMQSRVSPTYGVRVQRQIVLSAIAPTATITNTLTRVAPNVFPVHIWTVTQINTPQITLLDMAPDRAPRPGAWESISPPRDRPGSVTVLPGQTAVAWRIGGTGSGKIGTLGRWVAAMYDDVIFLQRGSYNPHGAYPDASSVQVFSTPDYVEMELLSPLVHLQPGQSISNQVTWTLLDRPSGAPVEQVVQRIQNSKLTPGASTPPDTPQRR